MQCDVSCLHGVPSVAEKCKVFHLKGIDGKNAILFVCSMTDILNCTSI